MSWTMESVDPHSEQWDQLLTNSEHLLFHEAIWSEVVREGVSSRVVAILFKEDGVPKSGAVGFLLGGYGINIAYFNFPYGGIIGSPPPSESLKKLLSDFAKQYSVCQIQFVGFPGAPAVISEDFEFARDTTHVLELNGVTPESLWEGYRRSRRQDIRKARERGITVEETSDMSDVDMVHDFYLQTMARTGGLARYKKSLLRAIVSKLGPKTRAHMYIAKMQGTPIAGMLLVDSKHLSHGLLMASSDDGLKHQPNKLMLHTAAERCTLKGLAGLDYMPSGQSASGVTNFKNLWGANEVKLRHATVVTKKYRAMAWRTAFAIAKKQPFRSILSMLRRMS